MTDRALVHPAGGAPLDPLDRLDRVPHRQPELARDVVAGTGRDDAQGTSVWAHRLRPRWTMPSPPDTTSRSIRP